MKNLLIITSYISGHGGMERIINKITNIVESSPLFTDVKISVVSLSDGVYLNKKFYSKADRSTDWIECSSKKIINGKFSITKLNKLYHVYHIVKVLKKEKFSHVISTGPGLCYLLSKVRWALKQDFTIFGWPHFSSSSGNGEFKFFGYSDRNLCISKGIMHELDILLPQSKNILFPNPVDHNEIKIQYDKPDGVNFCYIGRFIFEGQKRIKDLLDACLLSKTNFTLHLIGDGPDYKLIVDYIDKFKLKNKVVIHRGWHDDPWRILEKIDALILTSAYEGLPTVIGEALSRGIPCISSDCPTGPSDFINDPVNGKLFKIGATLDLSKILDDIVNKELNFDPIETQKSIEYFYIDNFVNRLQSILS